MRTGSRQAVRAGAVGAAAVLSIATGAFAAHRAFSPADDAAAHVMTAVNMGEIEESQLALRKATDARVRQLAQTLATDHMNAMHMQYMAFERMGMDNALEEAMEDGFERMGMGMNAGTTLPDRPNQGLANVARDAPQGSSRDAEYARVQEARAQAASGDGRAPNPAATDRDGATGTPVVPDRPTQGTADVAREAPLGSTRDAERTAIERQRAMAASGDGRAPNPAVRAEMQGETTGRTVHGKMDHDAMGHGGMNHAMMPVDMEMRRDVTAALTAHANSRPLVEDHQRAMAMLQGMSGMAFDRAFVQRQVMAHQAALRSIDGLLPHVREHGNAMSAQMLEQFRASVASHLAMAQQLHAQMGGR